MNSELCTGRSATQRWVALLMKFWKKTLLFTTATIGVVLGCANASKTMATDPKTDPAWHTVDSLAAKGQYATALEATEQLLARAHAAGDWRNEFRAVMYRTRFRLFTGVDQREVIADLEARAATASAPLKPLLHSVVAEAYWNWYEGDQWEIMERSALAEAGPDPDTWDQAAFMRKVIAEYRASLEPYASLSSLPIGELGPLLVPTAANTTTLLRPTLHDVLAHRALERFRDSRTRLSEPAWRFQLDDAAHFALFEPFVHRELTHRDSGAWEFQALQLFQRLERQHLRDTEPDALVDVMLDRLRYVHERSILAEKDSLYLRALEQLRSRLPKNACEAEVIVELARRHAVQGDRYQRLDPTAAWKGEKQRAVALAREAIAQWPGTFGARNAEALVARLQRPSLQVEAEEAVVPDEAFRLAVTWTNVGQLHLRVVADDERDGERGYRDQKALERLLAKAPVRAWSVALPDDGDLNTHRSEVAVEGLPIGAYQVIVSSGKGFRSGADEIAFTPVRITRLALADRRTGDNHSELIVTDRSSGAAMPGVRAELFTQRWENRAYRDVLLGSATTDADGMAKLALRKGTEGQYKWVVTHGGEKLNLAGYGWYREAGEDNDSLRTFLFTDRAIYRPGQELYYKGIVTVHRKGAPVVKTGYRTTIALHDVNGDEVATQEVVTDTYGAFHGSFRTPQGVLTGEMELHEEHGSRSFQVEEYKRPTFEVVFDPVTASPKLNELARVSGVAKSYAGVPLDGAEVRWTVQREARMPWWLRSTAEGWFWRSMVPWGQPTEIATGSTTSNASGAFTVEFLAAADRTISRQADPTFTYTVTAHVVDINGEAQEGSTGLSVGYRSIDIDLQLGEALDRNTESIRVEVKNLNGQVQDVPMDIRIERLVAPTVPLRERRWERPDRSTIDRAQHDKLFPADVFVDEDEALNWPVQAVAIERKAWRAAGKAFPLDPKARLAPGTYAIRVAAKDASGTEVVVRKAVTVFDAQGTVNGFAEAFHVQPVNARVQPGEKAVLLVASALPNARVLLEVERKGKISERRWINLANAQQRIELAAAESDRGGFTAHLRCVERGREHRSSTFIDVPWTNKELQVEWMTFRDKLLPGAKEEWRLRITGEKNSKVAAQVLAAMYDASLDHFVPHDWSMALWSANNAVLGWNRAAHMGLSHGQVLGGRTRYVGDTAHVYPLLNTFDFGGRYGYASGQVRHRSIAAYSMAYAEADMMEAAAPPPPPGTVAELQKTEASMGGVPPAAGAEPGADVPQPAVRTDFRETAFFFPELLTDKDGAVILKFTMPEALTRWKLLGLAHTQDLQVGSFTKETITQKPLMVVPNLPRFLRTGDRITLTAKINAIEAAVNGTAKLELFDPFTNKALNAAFGLNDHARTFQAAPGQSANVAWNITVPEGVSVVSVRITAGGNGFSDGEEKPLPVLSDKLLVTESLPLWSNGHGTKTFSLDKLKQNSSTTLRTQSLKLEYTPNPAWYAVQALPYLMEYPHACAEQVFSRYYANTLAADIVGKRPKIKAVFEQWKSPHPSSGVDAFASALEKNQELKSVLLEETPWVLNARNERESKERIALLFDLQRMGSEQAAALRKLEEMQLPNGAWPWWSGMRESRYITQHVVAGFGQLETLGAADLRPDGEAQVMIKHAVRWLDGELERDHRERQRLLKKADLEKYVPSGQELHHLYARSFYPRWAIDGATRSATDFLLKRLANTWLQRGLQEQALAALVLHRLGDKATAQLIMKSLSERATRDEELGMYWKGFGPGMDWWAFPTETHALLIAAYNEVTTDPTSVNALRTYLLRLKQTTDWKTTKATADACYALLLSGNDWLEETTAPVITVGGQAVRADQAEAGTGTFEHVFAAETVKPTMGEVSITSTSGQPSWGALHWQYLEQMDKITPHESPFSIRKQVLLRQASDAGTQLVALDKVAALKPGDRLTIRIELRTDRPVDYVHLKDLRAAGLEPTETLSGYRYAGGLGFYRSTRDASVDFFFDRIMPGTYVLEYELKVAQAGDFSNGITTAMCMYAPAFSSHSAGERIVVGK